ncbi:NFXL1 [Cordylochernes scorpioides]|uniref:NFXL1 n=1 Tax=Cordylochernes scorpioides TaxID=51811 RepID=A0ABY6KWS6_9ARAC|nr:NFXL1 [Cordylochernes scorpioides]
MNWPARSPDLNPIEHAWGNLGRRISSLQPPPRNTHELETALTQDSLWYKRIKDKYTYVTDGLQEQYLAADVPKRQISLNLGSFRTTFVATSHWTGVKVSKLPVTAAGPGDLRAAGPVARDSSVNL